MDNFDLRKYLIENKATTNSKIINEGKTYYLKSKDFYNPEESYSLFGEYIDLVNDYTAANEPDLLDAGIDFTDAIELIGKHGQLLFEIEATGIDPETDGVESYYRVTNPEVLQELAQTYAQSEEYYKLASAIKKGKYTGFMITSLEYLPDDSVVIPMEPGFEEIEKFVASLQQNKDN